MSTPTPPALIVQIAREQGGILPSRAVCVWCKAPGATEPHHWLFKRSSGVPDEVLHTKQNVVLLHTKCHSEHGQTKLMTMRCLEWKIVLGYDISGWVEEIAERGLITNWPGVDIYTGIAHDQRT
jgi:hypothetical protein